MTKVYSTLSAMAALALLSSCVAPGETNVSESQAFLICEGATSAMKGLVPLIDAGKLDANQLTAVQTAKAPIDEFCSSETVPLRLDAFDVAITAANTLAGIYLEEAVDAR